LLEEESSDATGEQAWSRRQCKHAQAFVGSFNEYWQDFGGKLESQVRVR
jgi:hypothetical protein